MSKPAFTRTRAVSTAPRTSIRRRVRTALKGFAYSFIAVGFIALSMSYAPVAANAGPTDPDMSQGFVPARIFPGTTTAYQVTLTNVSGNPQKTGLQFTMTFPAGMTIAAGSGTTTCGGNNQFGGSITNGASGFTWAGRMDAGMSSCVITVPVTATGNIGDSFPISDSNFTQLANSLNKPGTTNAINLIDNWGSCPTAGYLFQNQEASADDPSYVHYINLVTGTNTGGTNAEKIGQYVNALGYNIKDDFVWGWNQKLNVLTRVNFDPATQNFSLTNFPGILTSAGTAYTPPGTGFNIGDVNAAGILTMSWVPGNTFVQVDLNAHPPVVITDTTRPLAPLAMADWGFIRSGNANGVPAGYYGVGKVNLNNSTEYRLYRTEGDGTDSVVATLTGLNDTETGSFGAAYVDNRGYLYVANNDTGHIFRITINGASSKYQRFSNTGLIVSGNDGARCASAEINLDFGDAPDSYKTTLDSNGPFSEITSDLQIGATNTAEDDGVPGAQANSDHGDDGIPGVAYTDTVPIVPGTTKTVTVHVTNSTGSTATLAGWIDLNKNGVFNTGVEQKTVNVPNGTDGNVTLSWTVPAGYTGASYMRLRLIPNGATVSPSDVVATGEVEDYRIVEGAPPVATLTLQKDVISRGAAGDQFGLAITGGSVSGATATTTGAATGIQTQKVGPISVSADGTTYTFTESAAGTTSLPAYTTTYSCTNGVSGTGATFTITPDDGDAIVCTFSNTANPVPHLTVQKVVSGRVVSSDQFTLTATGGTLAGPSNTVTTSGTSTGLQSAVVGPLNIVTGTSYTVSESAAGGTNLALYTSTYSCTNGASGTGTSVVVTPAGSENIVCTFTNTPIAPTLGLRKTATRYAAGDQFTLTISNPSVLGTTTTTSTANGPQTPVLSNVAAVAGTTYTFTETASAGASLANYTTTWACIDTNAGGAAAGSGSGTSFTRTPTAAQALVCTFTNTALPAPQPTLTVQKNVDARFIATDQFTLLATGGALTGPTNTATTTGTSTGIQTAKVNAVSVVSGTTYTISETGASGANLANYTTGYVCVDTANGNAPVTSGSTASGTVTIPTGAATPSIVCTFTNAPLPATLTVQKNVDGRVVATDQFTLLATGGALTGPANTATTAGTSTGIQTQKVNAVTVVTGTTYAVSESSAGGANLANYESTYECVDTANGNAPVTSGSGTSTNVQIPAGALAQHIVCTFTNTPIPPTLTVLKNVVDRVLATDQFTLTATGGALAGPTNTATTTGTANGVQVQRIDEIATVAGTTYTVSETAAGGANLALYTTTYACDSGLSGSGRTFTITPLGSEAIVCTFTNTPIPVPVVTVQKDVAGRVAGTDQFTLSFTGPSVNQVVTTTGQAAGIQSAKVGPVEFQTGQQYAITETAAGTTVLANYTTTWECIDAFNGNVANGTGTSIPTFGSNLNTSNITCTFTNTPIVAPPTLTVQKNIVSRNAGNQFTLSATGGALSGATATTTGSALGIQPIKVNNVTVVTGTTYTVSEAASGSTVLSNYTSTYACVDTANGNAPVASGSGTAGSVTIPTGANSAAVVCTFTNTLIPPPPTLTVQKSVDGRVVSTDQFTLTASGGILLGATATTTGTSTGIQAAKVGPVDVTTGTSYTVAETASGGTNLALYTTSYVCVDAANGNAPVTSGSTRTGSVVIPTGVNPVAVVCTFTNTPLPSTLSVYKDVVNRGLTTDQFTITATGGALTGPTNTATTTGTSTGVQAAHVGPLAAVAATSYTVTETAAGTTNVGLYTTTWSCVNGATTVASGSGRTGTFTMPAAAAVVCTFTNTPIPPAPSTITVVKDVVSRGLATDQFTVTATGGALTAPTNTATTAGTATGVQTQKVGPLAATGGTLYSIAETAAAGTDLSLYSTTWSCANGVAIVASGSGLTGSFTMPTGADVVCTFTNTAIAPQLRLDKSSSTASALPGGTIDYTVTAENVGSVHANGKVISDPIPTGLTAFSWSCVATSGAICPNATGTGAISQTIATFPAGGQLVYSITATVSATPPSTVRNIASVNVPICLVDGIPADPCEDKVDTPLTPQLTVQKTLDGRALAGDQFTLTATGGSLVGATATTSGTAIGLQAAKVGPVVVVVGTTYTIAETAAGTTDVAFYQSSWQCVNTANANAVVASGLGRSGTVTIPSAVTPANVVCTFTNAQIKPEVTLDKIAITPWTIPGGQIEYQFTVSNTGQVHNNGLIVTDNIPTGITAFTWTCAATGGAICPTASGTGSINQTIATFPAGGVVRYDIIATVSETPPKTVINTGESPIPECLVNGVPTTPCKESPPVEVYPLLTVQKNVDSRVQTTDQFTLTATGLAPTAVAASTTNATTTGTATGIQPIKAGPLATARSAVYSISESAAGTTDTGRYATTWQCVNTQNSAVVASGTGRTGTVTMPNNAVDVETVVCTFTNTRLNPAISITKTTTTPKIVANGTANFAVTVTNTGVIGANGTVVTDPIPTGLNAFTWTCAATGGAICPSASGTGAINQTVATFPVASSLVYSIVATVVAAPPATITNIAQAVPPTGGTCDPGNTAPPCIASVGISPDPLISILKTSDTDYAVPNSTIDYEVLVTNRGSIPADGTVVKDNIPVGLSAFTWTCAVTTGAAVCPHVSGTGAINETLATFPAGSSVTYSITANVVAKPPAEVLNIATADPPGGDCDPGYTEPPCTSEVPTPSIPIVDILKTADVPKIAPNGTIVYTITAYSLGSVPADGAVITDAKPTGIDSMTWTCATTGGAICPTASGSGDINETIATFPPASTVIYTITAKVAATPPASIENIALVTGDPPLVCPDLQPTPCESTVDTPTTPAVSISKTADKTDFVANDTVIYTVLVKNTGGVKADGAAVADPLVSGLASYTWTCLATGGAICPHVSGTGAVNETIATFPVGATITYSVTAKVSATPPALIKNVATVDPPADGICTPAGNEGPCSSSVTIRGPILALTGVFVWTQVQIAAIAIFVGGLFLVIQLIRRRKGFTTS